MTINIPWDDITEDYFTLDFTSIMEGTSNSVIVTSSSPIVSSSTLTRNKILTLTALNEGGNTPNTAYLQVYQTKEGIVCKIANDQSDLEDFQ